MKCPVDREVLVKKRYEADVDVEECSKCRGVWLDPGELERIQATRERDYAEELRGVPDPVVHAYEMARQKMKGERTCPACGRALEKREHGFCSRILVDSCPSCHGVWLDRGELEALEVFFERARQNAADAGLARGFFGSLRDLWN